MNHLKLIIFLTSLSLFEFSSAKENQDSVLLAIQSMPNDTNKVKALNDLAYATYRTNPEISMKTCNEALILSKDLNFIPGQIKSNNILGINNLLHSKYYESELNFTTALRLADSIYDKTNISKTANNLGALFVHLGDYNRAITYQLAALEICEESNDYLGVAKSYANIGIMHKEAQNYNLALEYLRKGVSISDSINDKQNLSICLNGIGTTHSKLKNYETSTRYYKKAILLYEKVSDLYGLAITYGNIAGNFILTQDYDSALVYITKSNKYAVEVDSKRQIISNYGYMSSIYLQLGSYTKAEQFALTSYKLAIETNAIPQLQEITQILANVYSNMHQYQKAFKFLDLSKTYSDSLLTAEKQDLIIELDAKFNSERKQREIELLQKDQLLQKKQLQGQEQQIKYHRLQVIIILLALLSVVILAYVFYRSSRNKKHSNDQLRRQRNTIAKQNKNITDSIIYAQHIQEAILPEQARIRDILPDSFLLFIPRDIVSGDFFWIKKHKNKILLAVVDCTGHGVPGAFMSILGTQLLNEIEEFNQSPAELLNELRDKLKLAMKQSDYFTSQRDGMDIGLCSIDTGKKTLQYAGANIHLINLNKDEIYLTKANNQPVAIYLKESDFTNHTFNYTPDDRFYMASDGYADQYGGELNQKFKSKQLRQLLKKTANISLIKQKQKIHTTFLKWQGDKEQIDDVTVFGFKCPE